MRWEPFFFFCECVVVVFTYEKKAQADHFEHKRGKGIMKHGPHPVQSYPDQTFNQRNPVLWCSITTPSRQNTATTNDQKHILYLTINIYYVRHCCRIQFKKKLSTCCVSCDNQREILSFLPGRMVAVLSDSQFHKLSVLFPAHLRFGMTARRLALQRRRFTHNPACGKRNRPELGM